MAPVQKKAPVKGKGPASKKKQGHKFVIDCTTAETDSILDTSQFEKYLKEKIKVDGKAGNLGDTVAISRDKSKIVVTAEGLFSKRYLKYLSKKFLKKLQMRDFLRIVSTNKSTYELKYYNIQENDDDAGDE
ncbi:large subunit ribosomal protein L22e, cytoplasmic [Guillardia theta CCMP2712]|uniref:Large ribosomal subunit protein eL22 n=2 Tax=Guillardia theta TaxID=55529 RepID=L1IUW5_GUITC|nr:large subunit ribosomal protein L22e, cytoplasmic [Guillardia theta CCMP2712]EKX39684.1 large subunit ribosomal protein L22e, cytoplasmic [Guillardia theta CCMP2712]|eukprot:XP_005826664.1 large subunit ribosomal protein L22e, cytoplasmic [Guillardia theta CCMP2712]